MRYNQHYLFGTQRIYQLRSSFFQAFRHFVGHRGLPTKIISDNAKEFKAVSKDISKVIRSTAVLTTGRCLGNLLQRKPPGEGGLLGTTR